MKGETIMKKLVLILMVSFIAVGCCQLNKQKKNKVLVRINNYEITVDEFNKDFNDSAYARRDDTQSKKDFLNFLIDKKLMLQEAQGLGLDKEKSFLDMVESFWEQSLLKLIIEKKSKEIASSVQVSDKEIQDAYQTLLKQGKVDKDYYMVRDQIRWDLIKEKETKMMNDWINSLKAKADIEIDYKLMDPKETKR